LADYTYSEIKEYRQQRMGLASKDHFELNRLHDELIKKAVEISIDRIKEELGDPPTSFCFFVMGSAGRFEQSVWSDQDHGIIFQEDSKLAQNYFLKLGKEIAQGLYIAGYPFCDGGVMAGNPLWCKSLNEWSIQLKNWINEPSWETIRHLLIFMDGRSLAGEDLFIKELKREACSLIHKEHLLARLLDNTMLLKKGVGLLGQFLTETHGPHSGLLNIKEKALYPYVNAVRILALKECITDSSTLSRLQKLSEASIPASKRLLYEKQFYQLLDFRLQFGDHSNYDSGHFLLVSKLSAHQKKAVKEVIKNGPHLYQFVRKLVEKEP